MLIKEQVNNFPIIVYMRGTPDMPLCDASRKASLILRRYNISFAYVDVLHNFTVFRSMPNYTHSQTFPQIFISGEFLGSTDILLKLHLDNSLADLLSSVHCKKY